MSFNRKVNHDDKTLNNTNDNKPMIKNISSQLSNPHFEEFPNVKYHPLYGNNNVPLINNNFHENQINDELHANEEEDDDFGASPAPSFTQIPPPPLPNYNHSGLAEPVFEPHPLDSRALSYNHPSPNSELNHQSSASFSNPGFDDTNVMVIGSDRSRITTGNSPYYSNYYNNKDGLPYTGYVPHTNSFNVTPKNPYGETTTTFKPVHHLPAAYMDNPYSGIDYSNGKTHPIVSTSDTHLVTSKPSAEFMNAQNSQNFDKDYYKSPSQPKPPKWVSAAPFPLHTIARSIYMLKSKFWDRKSFSEKFFTTALLTLLLTLGILSWVVRLRNSQLRNYHLNRGENARNWVSLNNVSNQNVCLSPFCVSLSARLLNSMNLSADPCQDFYEFSCGGWVRGNSIPDGQSSWNNFLSLYQKNQYILRKILENKDTKYECESEIQAKTYFDSCMDENDTVEWLGAQPIIDLQASYGGWNFSLLRYKASQIVVSQSLKLDSDPDSDPKNRILLNGKSNNKIPFVTYEPPGGANQTTSNVLTGRDRLNLNLTDEEREALTCLLNDGYDKDSNVPPVSWNLQDRLERTSRELSLYLLFSVYVSDDDKNSTHNVIYLDSGKMSLPKRDYYLNMTKDNLEILTGYLKYMIGVGLLLANKQDQLSSLKLQREQKEIVFKSNFPGHEKPEEQSLNGNRFFSSPKTKKSHISPARANKVQRTDEKLASTDYISLTDDLLNQLERNILNKLPPELLSTNIHGFETFRRVKKTEESGERVNTSQVGSNHKQESKNETLNLLSSQMEFYKLVTKSMANVIAFETKLANITPTMDDMKNTDKNYNSMTVLELQTRFDFINWTSYLNNLFSVVNYTVKPDQVVILRSLDYFTNLTVLVKEYLGTRDKITVLNNYFMWHLTSRMIPYLSQEFRATLKPLSKALKGVYEGTVAWRTCLADTNNIIGFPLGSLFVKEAFKGKNKFLAESMINKIKDAFKSQLPTLDWMDEDTIKVAAEKADAIRNKIGFPDYLLNPKELDKKYKGLQFEPDQYFSNNLRQLKFYLRKDLIKITKPVDKARWSLTPPTVNAYYLATGNEMVFPAGILQSPFYDKNFPKALNFGAMGFVVGHELTHGFDDQGRQFDKNGNLKPWWNNASVERFNQRAQCLERQYSSYKLENLNINGKQTIGENIADNGGLKATFAAFKKYMRDNKVEDPILPGLNMTDNQLFFLAFAQVWCSIDTKKSLYFEILNDMHSPNQIRVIGTVSNSAEFAKAYNCPLNSRMNPTHKCIVW